MAKIERKVHACGVNFTTQSRNDNELQKQTHYDIYEVRTKNVTSEFSLTSSASMTEYCLLMLMLLLLLLLRSRDAE